MFNHRATLGAFDLAKLLEDMVQARGIELRPVIENTEVADSKRRQKR
jgi:hypothetical protein